MKDLAAWYNQVAVWAGKYILAVNYFTYPDFESHFSLSAFPPGGKPPGGHSDTFSYSSFSWKGCYSQRCPAESLDGWFWLANCIMSQKQQHIAYFFYFSYSLFFVCWLLMINKWFYISLLVRKALSILFIVDQYVNVLISHSCGEKKKHHNFVFYRLVFFTVF